MLDVLPEQVSQPGLRIRVERGAQEGGIAHGPGLGIDRRPGVIQLTPHADRDEPGKKCEDDPQDR
jgi:hypothetical protein